MLKQLIPLLKQTGLKVGAIKHSHHSFDVDHPGKDSFELRAAGATPVMITSSKRRAIIMERETPQEPSLAEELAHLEDSGLDLILVEGFKHEHYPKIELHRPALGKPLLFPDDDSIIALATEDPKPGDCLPIPRLDLNDPRQIADFILDWLRLRSGSNQPLRPCIP